MGHAHVVGMDKPAVWKDGPADKCPCKKFLVDETPEKVGEAMMAAMERIGWRTWRTQLAKSEGAI
jgi:hypothetical protein